MLSSGRRAFVTVALCCLAAIVEGYDIQSMGVAAPGLAPALHLTRDQLGPAFSASTVGLFIGAIAIGRLADRVGRKWALAGSLATFGLFSLATPVAPGVTSLLAIRLAAGLGLGGAMPNLIALASEAVSPPRQASLVAISAASMPLGGSIASGVAASLPWREIFVIGGAAPLALAAVMAPALPESARFLAARAAPRSETAQDSLAATYFGGGRALASLMLWIAAFCALLVLYLLLNWLPLLMAEKGAPKTEAALVSLLFNLAGCAGTLLIAVLFAGTRRGLAFVVWYVGMAVTTMALALTPSTFALAGAAGLAAGFFIPSAPTAIYALAPDVYAVRMLATGLGGVIGLGRIGAILGPLLAGALLARGRDATGVLLALLPFVAVAALATFVALSRRPRLAPSLAAPESGPEPA
jgi:AAHS family 3-hydroxyphenylpropionic acid transporter